MQKAAGLEISGPRAVDVPGIGISAVGAPLLRHRALTMEDLSISSVEGTKPSYLVSDNDSSTIRASDWEKVTWEFSDILQSISSKEKESLPVVLTKAQQLVQLLADHPPLKHEIVIANVLARILFMLYDPKPLLRSTAYRILRHTLAGRETVAQLVQHKLLMSLTVSLSTPTLLIECEEALKLIRAIMDVPEGLSLLSVGVIKALVALTERETEESLPLSTDARSIKPSNSLTSTGALSLFYRLCVETLCELLLLNPPLVFQGGGFRLLLSLSVSAPAEVSFTCILAFLTLLDHPDARSFLRGGSDLDCLLSAFNLFEDNDETSKLHRRAMDSAFLISILMKSWTGLLFFCHDNFAGFRLLLMNLKRKNAKLHAIILDLLMDVLRLKTLPWLEASRLGALMKRFTTLISPAETPTSSNFEYAPILLGTTAGQIVAHYQGLLLKILIICDIRMLLIGIINDARDPDSCDKATVLIKHIFEMAVNYLPVEFYQDCLFGSFSEPISPSTISKINVAIAAPEIAAAKKVSVRNSVREMTLAHRANLDDAAFKALLSNAKTLHLKDYTEWNWVSLSQLFLGPMRLPRRFAEVQEKYPKLLKAFLSFLRPFKYRFGQIPIVSERRGTLKNPKVAMLVASQLLELLLTFDEGAQFLASNKLMPQLAEILAQVDPTSGITSWDPILSDLRLKSTLSIGYVRFIGVFSNSLRGIKILELWQLVHLMNGIVEGSVLDEQHNHLIFNLLSNLNYSVDSPLRLLLQKSLSVSNLRIKLFVLDQILPTLVVKPECENFVIDLLVCLLFDEHDDVVLRTIILLHDFYTQEDNAAKIDYFIDSQPSVTALERSEYGTLLLLRFCKRTRGFEYLLRIGYIDSKFKDSVEQLLSFEYLDNIEGSLRCLFYPHINLGPQQRDRHFFHYLLSTEEGVAYFKQHQRFLDSILQNIRSLAVKLKIIEGEPKPRAGDSPTHSAMTTLTECAFESEEYDYGESSHNDDRLLSVDRKEEIPQVAKKMFPAEEHSHSMKQLKQNMWILGEIAAAKYGFQLLDPSYSIFVSEKHIAEVIVAVFKTGTHWQFRGLAFYILGAMSSTEEGVEILDELNWISVKSPSLAISLAYPASMGQGKFMEDEKVVERNFLGSEQSPGAPVQFDIDEEVNLENQEETVEGVLSLLNCLSSILGRIERKARSKLLKIKGEVPHVFSDVSLFLRVVDLLERGTFKYRIRVFIFSLFDTFAILSDLVKRRRKNTVSRSEGR